MDCQHTFFHFYKIIRFVPTEWDLEAVRVLYRQCTDCRHTEKQEHEKQANSPVRRPYWVACDAIDLPALPTPTLGIDGKWDRVGAF